MVPLSRDHVPGAPWPTGPNAFAWCLNMLLSRMSTTVQKFGVSLGFFFKYFQQTNFYSLKNPEKKNQH